MSGTEAYPTDEQGHFQCPDCKKWINCAQAGAKFLEARHRGKKKCQEDTAKLAVKGPRLKNASIMSFLRPGGPAHRVPSQTQAPAPVIVPPMNTLQPVEGVTMPIESQSHLDNSEPPTSIVNFYKTPLANSFQTLVDALPPPNTTDGDDPLSSFDCDPALHDKQYISNEDLWEELLNPLLKKLLGWADTLDVGAVIEGKRGGLMGVSPFIEYYVQKRKVSEGLFEGKLTHLMSGLANVPKTRISETVVNETSAPNVIPPPAPVLPVIGPNYTQPVDVDALLDQSKQTATLPGKNTASAHICDGYELDFPPGASPYSDYPFSLHLAQRLPWNLGIFDGKMSLYSSLCKRVIKAKGTTCDACKRLGESTSLDTVHQRIEDGEVPDHIPYAYRSMAQLQATLHHKDGIINHLRLRGLNQARSLVANAKSLSEYKRFVVAVSSGRYANVSRLIRVGLGQNRSIAAITRNYHAAAKGTYQPKSFTEEEDMIGLLLFRLGGSRVAGIAHRALGLPAVSTLRSRVTMPPLIPSHAFPTTAEVIQNIEACYEGIQDILNGKHVHQIAMFDEIATEKRLRWDEKSNHFLGVCREHGIRTSLEFNSIEDMEELFTCLERNQVHCAAEATVCALGILSEDTRIYAGRPVLISGDCKKESGEEHSHLIQTVLDAASATKSQTKLRVVSIASDGEKRRGSAFIFLTFKHKLLPTSPLYPYLSCLKFMDLYVGDDDLTADKDWKHVIKRFRNLLLRSRGILILGIRITPSITQSHLKMAGLSAVHVNALFSPNDEQDVKLAFDLLKAIWSLPALAEHQSPSVLEARAALRTLGKLVYHIVFPYLCVDLSLSEQLEHFSAGAHLALILYRASGKAFLPTLLYVDLMIMIKNIFFCVGKAKVDNPDSKFYVMLLGTDRLEELFGILRTMIGNDANLDTWQLASRLTGTTLVSNILAKYPHWDRPPRRLKLPAITRDSEELPTTSDHIKPASWRGDVSVKSVTLQTSWNRGRRLVEEECDFAGESLQSMDTTSQVTILAPFTVLLVTTSLDEEDESQESILTEVLPRTELEGEEPSHTHNPIPLANVTQPDDLPSSTYIVSEESEARIDIEDAFIASDSPPDEYSAVSLPAIAQPKHDRFIIYSGKKMLKSRALSLRTRLTGKNTTSSTDRLKRVQEIERYGKGATFQSGSLDIEVVEEQIIIQDPVGTLVRCDEHIFLCVGEVNGIRIDSRAVDSISLQEIAEADSSKITIALSLLGLRGATTEDSPSLSADWRSYRMTSERTIQVPARNVLAINPSISNAGIGKMFYLFEGRSLVTIAASLFGVLAKADVKRLPHIPATKEFPYTENTGKACFSIASPQLNEITETMGSCPGCNFDLAGKGGPRTLAHMASHILYDPKINRQDLPCGLCLRPSPLCLFVMGKGSGGQTRINWTASVGCQNKLNFKYASAKESTVSSPCSNVPLECPACPTKSAAQWRYNLREHFLAHHTQEAFKRHEHLWTLSKCELDEMKRVWKDRNSQPVKRSNQTNKKKIIISEGHTTHASLRDTQETVDDESGEETETEGEPELDPEPEPSPTTRPSYYDNHETLHKNATAEMEIDDLDLELPEYVPVGSKSQSMLQAHNVGNNTDSDAHFSESVTTTAASSVDNANVASTLSDSTSGVSSFTELPAAAAPPVSLNNENPLPVTARPQRKRGRINIQELSKCVCGEVAPPAVGDSAPTTIECKQNSCETRWYHMACVNLNYISKTWRCDACVGDRNGKRVRGL